MRHGRTGARVVEIALATLLAVMGCDDRHSVTVIDNKTPSTQPARPTTQQLLTGTQQKIALRSIPFTLTVPQEWHIKQQAGLVMVEGATPSGVVQIQVGRHASLGTGYSDRLIEGAKREAITRPGPYVRAEVRKLSNNIQMLETRSSETTSNKSALDALGAIIAPTSTPLNWKLSAFLTNTRDSDVCEVHFIDLTSEQYDLDKELLDRVMASFEYDVKAESN